jgi:hypothetical protein
MAALSDAQRLANLSYSGMRVDGNGRVVDPRGRPHLVTRPRQYRIRFSREDDRILSEWVDRAGEEGLPTSGLSIFEDMAIIV